MKELGIKISLTNRSDMLGALSSGLCMIHCLATPLLFLAQSNKATCSSLGPWWWHTIDYLFIIVAIISIRRSNQHTTLTWMPYALYTSWVLLTLVMVNDKTHFIQVSGFILYIPGCSLVLLHLYNRHSCQC